MGRKNNDVDEYINNSNKKRRKHLIKKFFLIVFTIVSSFAVVGFFGAMCYKSKIEKEKAILAMSMKDNEKQDENIDVKPTDNDLKDKKLNIAIFGTDKAGYRADVNFVVCFDTETGDTSFVSVPRDTRVVMTDEMLSDMRVRGRENYIPYRNGVNGECKLTELHAYAGDGYRCQYSVMMLEDILGIDIDHYVKVDINGFKEIVNAIGGVDMYVPQNMSYSDPGQDLYINLQEGQQHLDGDKAEQLVRYREGYAQRDLMRIQVQHDFMKEFMKKVLSTKTILSNIPEIIGVIYKYVETDVQLSDCLKYVKYISLVNMDKVTMETIPGEGGSYFDRDEDGVKELVDRVFFGVVPPPEVIPEETTEPNVETAEIDSKNLTIEVANGGYTNGIAGKTRDRLNNLGYNVTSVSTWNGDQIAKTRIYVRKEGVGADLVPLFTDAELIVNSELVLTGTDIKIITGTTEK